MRILHRLFHHHRWMAVRRIPGPAEAFDAKCKCGQLSTVIEGYLHLV